MSQQLHPLMVPRYKCEIPYPDSDYEVGEIIHMVNDVECDDFYSVTEDGKFLEWERFYQSFPAIFRPMPWYEGREESEMNEIKYLKSGATGKVYKVIFHDMAAMLVTVFVPELGENIPCYYNNSIPATLSDFEAYQKSLK